VQVDLSMHFRFSGAEEGEATASIVKGTLQVQRSLHGEPDLMLRANVDTWLGSLAGERRLVPALLRRKLRVRGDLRRLAELGRCFAT